MENTHLLSLLVLWLNFMVQVIPLRLASTYMELLIGVKGEILFQKAQSPISKRRTGHSVWSQLPNQKSWTLILSTDLELTPEQIIKLFSKRWKTEPMFNEIKYFFGVTKAWQRSSRALHRWLSMLSLAYALTRLLSLIMNTKRNREILPPIPWRRKSPAMARTDPNSCPGVFSPFWVPDALEPKV